MRVLPIIVVGLVFASAAFLVQPVQAQPLSTVEGVVCASSAYDEGGCATLLEGATVRLTGGPASLPLVDETKTTDKSGRFSFANVVQGDYKVAVSRAGFVATTQDVSAPSAALEIVLKAQTIVVEGTVTDAAGSKVSGAYVHFWGPDWAYARTDASGNYLAELLAGKYTMEVDAGKRGYLQQEVFVDGTRIDVELGALAGQDARVKGRVVDQDGTPVSGADVSIDQWERKVGNEYQYGNFRNWTTTDANGEYALNVYAGSLSLRFSKSGYAEAYQWTEVGAGKTTTMDAEMAKYPEKTARLTGKIVDFAGNGLGPVSISIQHPEYGLYTCSADDRHHGAEPAYADSYDGDYAESSYYDPYYYAPECDITINDDGTFSGNVTPGYAIISVWYDHWASCSETRTSSGQYSRDCGPDYYSYTETLNLKPDADNALTIKLRERPGPDATISGYAVNGETDTAISNAYFSFNNEETYAWGQAETDKDGSYKVRVRSGYHHVSVWADGFLPWQGVVYIAKGADMPFDVTLTPGEARYGGCCYGHGMMYAEEAKAYPDGDSGSAEPREAPMSSPMPMESMGGSGEGYEDLQGGLGPYDAASRNAQLHSDAGKKSPVPIALVFAALGLVALRRRF